MLLCYIIPNVSNNFKTKELRFYCCYNIQGNICRYSEGEEDHRKGEKQKTCTYKPADDLCALFKALRTFSRSATVANVGLEIQSANVNR